MTVDILGTTYQIAIKKFEDDEAFERRSICGYCDGLKKEIAICDMSTYPGWEHDSPRAVEISQKQTMRHEIVHAFFYESGLADNSFAYDGAWAKNEEMVDWFSWQGPKIYAAWSEINALDAVGLCAAINETELARNIHQGMILFGGAGSGSSAQPQK